MKCGVCKSKRSTVLLDLNCGNLDNSTLYKFVKIVSCDNCGHIYNYLTKNEMKGLIEYYKEEGSLANLSSSVSNIGDRPGSTNEFTTKRHERMFNVIYKHINLNSKILDVGCAMGGFLDYLHNKGYKNLYGIDLSEGYINNKYDYDIQLGDACDIPFEDNTFDLVILDQVMEHVINSRKAIREVKRVLKHRGFVCIGVPDASKYDETYFFDFFWLLLREHIHHFDLEHLDMLMKKENFDLVDFKRTKGPMMTNEMSFYNLNALFRSNKTPYVFDLREQMKEYVEDQYLKLKAKSKDIDDLVKSNKPLYVWGVSREFMYLYENTNLKECNIIAIIDDIPYKRKFTFDNKVIKENSVLKDADEYSVLLITATAHKDVITKKALEIGYKGVILNVI